MREQVPNCRLGGAMTDISGLVAVVQIEEVRLVRLTVDGPDDDLPDGQTFGANIGHHAEVKSGLQNGRFTIHVRFTLDITRPSDQVDTGSEPIVKVRAQYAVSYSVPKDAKFSQKELTAFGNSNATFNTWPFWRELVHTAFVRMGLPPFTVPVFRVLPKRKEAPVKKTPRATIAEKAHTH